MKNKKSVQREARKEGESFLEESKEIGFTGVKPEKRYMSGTGIEANALQNRMEAEASKAGKKKFKTGGSMEPGGGGRFEKLVGKLKGQGKSEESAEAIAASAGRKKYGKTRFQQMAAAGKK